MSSSGRREAGDLAPGVTDRQRVGRPGLCMNSFSGADTELRPRGKGKAQDAARSDKIASRHVDRSGSERDQDETRNRRPDSPLTGGVEGPL